MNRKIIKIFNCEFKINFVRYPKIIVLHLKVSIITIETKDDCNL